MRNHWHKLALQCMPDRKRTRRPRASVPTRQWKA